MHGTVQLLKSNNIFSFLFLVLYRPVSLVKSNFVKIEDKASNYELFSSTPRNSIKSHSEFPLQNITEDKSTNISVQPASRICSLGTVSYCSSDPIVVDSLFIRYLDSGGLLKFTLWRRRKYTILQYSY